MKRIEFSESIHFFVSKSEPHHTRLHTHPNTRQLWSGFSHTLIGTHNTTCITSYGAPGLRCKCAALCKTHQLIISHLRPQRQRTWPKIRVPLQNGRSRAALMVIHAGIMLSKCMFSSSGAIIKRVIIQDWREVVGEPIPLLNGGLGSPWTKTEVMRKPTDSTQCILTPG